MRKNKSAVFSLVFICISPTWSSAQFFATCQCGSRAELEASIASHNEHIYRLESKFEDVYYFQGRVPREALKADLPAVLEYLKQLSPRRAAVVFYGYKNFRLCSWLISPCLEGPRFVSNADDVDAREFGRLYEELRGSIGVADRDPAGISKPPASAKIRSFRSTDAILDRLSHLLLPEPISKALLNARIDTLVVVPITINYPNEYFPDETQTASIGSIPFPALCIDGRSLVELMAVVIAPGFYVFSQPPLVLPWRSGFKRPVIVGDPLDPQSGWRFEPLPGARDEAINVAKILGAQALIGSNASRENVFSRMRSSPELVFLATHGFYDPHNPRDESFLVLSDGLWRAREIQKLALSARPLVVLSACQTALGKDFDVGTIGLARTWQWAGASNVVMSLWNINDDFAGKLMPIFMRLARQEPPEVALQLAMQQMRVQNKNPKYWSGFSVYGAPHRFPPPPK